MTRHRSRPRKLHPYRHDPPAVRHRATKRVVTVATVAAVLAAALAVGSALGTCSAVRAVPLRARAPRAQP